MTLLAFLPAAVLLFALFDHGVVLDHGTEDLITRITFLMVASQIVSSAVLQLMPPADDSKVGINAKWYAVLHGFVERASYLKPPLRDWTDHDRREGSPRGPSAAAGFPGDKVG